MGQEIRDIKAKETNMVQEAQGMRIKKRVIQVEGLNILITKIKIKEILMVIIWTKTPQTGFRQNKIPIKKEQNRQIILIIDDV